jgi:hypothetical protein
MCVNALVEEKNNVMSKTPQVKPHLTFLFFFNVFVGSAKMILRVKPYISLVEVK